MRNITRLFALSLFMSAGLSLSACSDDDPGTTGTTAASTMPTTTAASTMPNPNPTGTGPGTGTDNTGGGNAVPGCNPVGADAAMSALLNVPVAPTVQVIIKTPMHPNPNVPGPTGLPQ